MDKTDSLQTSEKPTLEQNVLTMAKGGSILAAGRLFEFGGRFIIAFLLARLLGAEQYGLYNLALSTATIVAGIAGLGLDSAMIRYVAILASKRDQAGVWGTLQVGIGGAVAMSVLMSAGLFVLAGPIAENLFGEPQLAALLQLFSVIVPFLALSDALVGVAHGFKKMSYTALAQNFVQLLVRVGLIGSFAFIGLNAFLTAVAFGLADVAASIVLIYLLNKNFPWRRPLNSARYDIREIANYSLPLWLSGLLSKFRKNLQTILLGSLSSVTNVGIFTLVNRINLVGRVTYLSMVTSVKPVIAELYGRGELAQMGSLYQTATRWTFTLNLPLFLVMVLFPQTLLSIFGQSFVGGAMALSVLACAELINAGTGICGSIIDMTGYTKIKFANSVLWIILSLSLNFLLIPGWGVLGAAMAATISMATINFLRVLEVWLLLRLLPYNLSFIKPIAAGLTALSMTLILDRWFPADTNLLYTALHGMLVFGVYAGVLLLLGLAPEDRTVLARTYQRTGSTIARLRGAATARPS